MVFLFQRLHFQFPMGYFKGFFCPKISKINISCLGLGRETHKWGDMMEVCGTLVSWPFFNGRGNGFSCFFGGRQQKSLIF